MRIKSLKIKRQYESMRFWFLINVNNFDVHMNKQKQKSLRFSVPLLCQKTLQPSMRNEVIFSCLTS